MKHYRIRQLDEGGFFIARRVTFRTLSELVDHYNLEADGLCVNLRRPCTQVRNLSSTPYPPPPPQSQYPSNPLYTTLKELLNVNFRGGWYEV